MKFVIPKEYLEKLEHYNHFRLIERRFINKPNKFEKVYTGKKLDYYLKTNDCFKMTKDEFINGSFINKLKLNTIFAVTVKSRYNGQFHGIILQIKRTSNDSFIQSWNTSVLNKTVNKSPSIPKGTKLNQGTAKISYFDISINQSKLLKEYKKQN